MSGAPRALTAILGVAIGSGLAACGGSRGADPDADANVALQDAHNYRARGDLSIPSVETASASDLEICWQDVISDFQCHDVRPVDDLDNVALLRLRLSEDAAEERLGSSELAQSEVDGYLDYKTDHSEGCTRLSSMSFFGTPIDIEEEYVESQDHTYVLVFTEGTTPGVGARSMIFVTPSESSTNTRVEAPSGCGLLDFTADIASVEPIEVPDEGPWHITWKDVTADSHGNEIDFWRIDGGVLGFYQGLTLEDLEQQVFDLEELATALWDIELASVRSADLAQARRRDGGQYFAGFSRHADGEEGVWLFALTCASCQIPAPIVLAVLQPVAGEG